MAGKKRSISLGADVCIARKEWDEALCPICMEHPHNAVLLLCSSHAKGCRSYICDTSYRHSNCLDRFRKLKEDPGSTSSATPPNINLQDSSESSSRESTLLFENELPDRRGFRRRERNTAVGWSRDSGEYDLRQDTSGRENFTPLRDQSELAEKSSLKCPLCRGDVLGWTVVEEARKHLNLKPRSCTRESCNFSGNYQELRRHARSIHPRVRPAEVDPSRERAWRRFEHQREHDDIVSAIRSAMPGAIVLGDYVIENSDRLPPVERERTSGDASGPWWTTLFLFQMLESMQSFAGPRSRTRPWTGRRRPLGSSSRQRYLWGENLLGLQDDEEDGDDSFTEEEQNMFADVSAQDGSPSRRQRRRLTQSRSNRDRL